MKIEPQHPLINGLWRLFGDPWLAMLGLGGLGHQLTIPFLMALGYWNVFLIVLVIDCLIYIPSEFKRIRF